MKLLVNLYWKYIASPEAYARYLGVKIGNNCLIATRFWSSEPYLIEIGSNCQITSGVRFHTHGGGNPVRNLCPDFDVFGKIKVEDWAYIGTGTQVMPGVTIGSNVVIGGGSVVVKDIPSNVVAVGNPCRVVRPISDEDKQKSWDWI